MNNSENVFEFLEELRKSGATEETISQQMVHFLHKKARETDTPYRGHFELTPLCNFDCKMCYVHLAHDQMCGRRLLSVNEWCDLIQQAVDAGMIRAALSGGECLTYPGFDEVYLYLKSKGVIVTVLTNGLLLNNERIRFFQKYKPGKIQISLYGSSDKTYEEVTGKRVFSAVMKNIIAAKASKLPVKISITPSKYMLDDIRNTIKLTKDLELPYAINIGLMTPRSGTGREAKEHDISVDEYIRIIEYNRILNNKDIKPKTIISFPEVSHTDYMNGGLKCGAGKSTFAINWLGKMMPCTQMNSISANPLEEGFLSAWNSINKEVKAYPCFSSCSKCKYSQMCDYCAAENEKMGSRYVLDKRWCERTIKMIENGLRPGEQKCD